MAPRLKEKYKNEIVPQARERARTSTNINNVPKLEKIVVNMGVGEAATDSKLIDAAVADLRTITGQQPMICRARKSIATFRLRKGQAIGAKVTLRGDRMYEFFDRLVATAIPRIRDFRGMSRTTASTATATTPWASASRSIFPEICLRGRRPHEGHGHHVRDHRQDRRGRQGASYRFWLPVCQPLRYSVQSSDYAPFLGYVVISMLLVSTMEMGSVVKLGGMFWQRNR